MSAPLRVTTTVDLGTDGKQFGVVNVPHSSDESVWGAIRLVIDEIDTGGMLDTLVESLGKPFLFTELGGAGMASATTVRIAEAGIQNLLRHFGVVDGEPTQAETRLMHSPDAEHFVIADDRGLSEILIELGDPIAAGQSIVQVHDIEKPANPPAVYRAERSGVLIGRRVPGPTQPGDCLAVIATDLEGHRS